MSYLGTQLLQEIYLLIFKSIWYHWKSQKAGEWLASSINHKLIYKK